MPEARAEGQLVEAPADASHRLNNQVSLLRHHRAFRSVHAWHRGESLGKSAEINPCENCRGRREPIQAVTRKATVIRIASGLWDYLGDRNSWWCAWFHGYKVAFRSLGHGAHESANRRFDRRLDWLAGWNGGLVSYAEKI
jgi:hypothetical protein